ncbi:MAG: N-terminal nucleophile aminohydrolase [Piptocephalis tieghemiana]|nr:MAG: N-terminal nucleophile aminohydrolase [Piptocephalis tieghemiana]
MCRFLLFKGHDPILLADLLTRPAHSIINQSFNCRLRIDASQTVNGDGFGVGWYDIEPKQQPCIFTSVLPAWNNLNLTRLAERIRSPLVYAHVRASTGGTASSETNCHPWSYGRLMWMHNGHIAQFPKFKRKLQASVRDELYSFVQGNTDSEWAFALFLDQLEDPLNGPFTPAILKAAMLRTIALLNQFAREANVQEPSLLNFAVTDGETVVCTRYINDATREAASLYFSSGSRFEAYSPGRYRMVKADKREDMVVIASEPLTFEKTDWLTVPTNTLVVITPKINVLLYPIDDEFFTTKPRKPWN